MRFQVLSVVWVLTILCLASYTAAFSHGASLSACTDMMPKHIRAHLQNPRNNYITIHTNISFFPGDKVPVTVRSTRDFMGFLLQARRVSNDQIAGTFVYVPSGSKLLTCFEDGDTVTHSDKSLKRNLSFVWKAPDQPIGDIRFFLSVVQSYFVYWARIESSTVFQQTQNRTTENPVASSIIRPTALQKPPGLNGAFSASKESSPPTTFLTEFAKFAPATLTRIAATLALDPVSSTPHVSEHPGSEKILYESYSSIDISQAGSLIQQTQNNETETEEELMPEASLQGWGLSFIAESYSSSLNAFNRGPNVSSLPTSVVCITCEEAMKGVSPTLNPSTSTSAVPITASPSVHLWGSLLLLGMEDMAEHSASEENMGAYQSLSAASRQMAEKSSMTQGVPNNFLPQAELTTYGEEAKVKKYFSANPLKKVTRALPKAAVSEGGGKSHKGPQFVTAQLGVLLGCSAVLGMVLAVGLRCIHSQYCHKRTEVTFSEPENNVVALQESGEMMHFRKIRENSFVLVQAEYNWVSPSSSGKKAVI